MMKTVSVGFEIATRWLLVMALSDGELAPEAAERVRVARLLPGVVKVPALLAVIEQYGLEGKAGRDVAREAFETSLDGGVETKDYPLALRFIGSPETVRATAWRAYRKLGGEADFPERARSAAARCDQKIVDDVRAYLGIAMEAGPEVFERVLTTMRSPVEIGAALERLSQWDDVRAVKLGAGMVKRLRQAIVSRREFEEVKDLDVFVRRMVGRMDEEEREELEADYAYFLIQNQGLPRCGVAEEKEHEEFGDLKLKLLRVGEGPEADYLFLETVLEVVRMAGEDEGRLKELEETGSVRVTEMVRVVRRRSRER